MNVHIHLLDLYRRIAIRSMNVRMVIEALQNVMTWCTILKLVFVIMRMLHPHATL